MKRYTYTKGLAVYSREILKGKKTCRRCLGQGRDGLLREVCRVCLGEGKVVTTTVIGPAVKVKNL